MSLKFGDRVAFTTPTTGTGTLAVDVVIAGSYVLPEDVGFLDGMTTYLWISDGNNFEICRATFIAGSPSHFSRDTVIVSKSGGVVGTSKINLSGSAEVRVVAPALFLQALVRSVNGNFPDIDGNVYLNASDIMSDAFSPPATIDAILDYLLSRLPAGTIADLTSAQTFSNKTTSTPSQNDNSNKLSNTAYAERASRFAKGGGWDLATGSTRTVADSDSGYVLTAYNGTTSTLQLPDNLTGGHTFVITNEGSGNMAINYTGSGGFLLWLKAGGSSSGNRTLAPGGVAVITCQFGGASAQFRIAGQGLT